MLIVSDTTPFSELAKVGRLELLGQVFGQVIVPEECLLDYAGIPPAAQARASKETTLKGAKKQVVARLPQPGLAGLHY